jgi:uncharacterized SAM-binding protein YcdF (DUF218 family)
MREFLSVLVMPLSIFWLLLAISGTMLLLKKKKATKWLFFIALIWLLVISTKFVPDLLVSRLENRFRSFSKSDCASLKNPVNIIVLGGGHSDDNRFPVNDRLSGVALGRMIEGIRILKLIPGSNLITSGYAGRLSISQAEVLKETAVMLGVDSSKIKTLTTTRNTSDEANTYKAKFGSAGNIIVVTDAIHMPRAMMLFKKAGLSPIPAPTNHHIKKYTAASPFSWMPGSGNMSLMEIAVHEYVGLLWAKTGGK